MTSPSSLRAADYLAHMIATAEVASSYTEGLTQETFRSDPKTQQAVIFNTMVLSEAAT